MYLDEVLLPPEGYHLASTFRYPKRFIYVAKSLSTLTFLAFYVPTYWGIHVFQGFVGLGALVFMTFAFLSTDIIRGVIQRGISRLLGYDISFYTLTFAPLVGTYTTVPGQFQPRSDVLLIAIAPLSLFLLLLVPLLFGLSGMISSAFAFFLIINISGTAWDLYFIWRLLRMPRGTVLYTQSILELLVFEPGASPS